MFVPLAPIFWIPLLAVTLTAAVYDWKWRRIPNWLTVSGVAAGLAVNPAVDGLAGLKRAAIGFGVAFAVGFVLFALRSLGGGDVKLWAAVGAIAGLDVWFRLFVVSALVGGVVALVMMAATGRVKKTLWNVFFILHEMGRLRAPHMGREELDVRSEKAMRLPRGTVVGASALIYLAATWR